MAMLTESLIANVTIALATVLCLVFGYYNYAHGYWRRRSIPYIPGRIPFGSVTSVMMRHQSFAERIGELYKQMRTNGHQYVGLYLFSRKALLAIDPILIKHVLSTHFQHFPGRGIYYDEKNDPLSAHLVALNGDQWKELRQKITPTFTSGKLKVMFPTVLKCAEQLAETVQQELIGGNERVEIKDFAARYTTDVIGSCAFGIECNSLKNPDAEFRQVGRRVFKQNPIDIINRMIARSWPWVAKKLKIRIINRSVSDFFINVVTETVTYRRKNNVTRNDFLQLLIGLMNDDKINSDSDNDNAKRNNNGTLTINEIAAQAFVFFLAGFETSASTITFVLYELAQHEDVQERVRNEVNEVLKRHDGLITYDAIMEMHYMEKVVKETMRKYPAFTVLVRKCAKDFPLPDGNGVLEKGIPVIIPLYELHHDPEYYPEPDVFDPERFQSDISILDHTYLPFGSGPRICIGSRFAMIQMKVAIASMIQNFRFKEKTNNPIKLNFGSFALSPMEGAWLNVQPITS